MRGRGGGEEERLFVSCQRFSIRYNGGRPCKYAVAHVQTGKGKPVRIPSKREFLSGFFHQLLKKERISEDHCVTLLLSSGQMKFVSIRIVKYLSAVLV